MRRLRLQFGVFFVLLAAALGILLWNSYRQMGLEESNLWRGQAEKVYNQMQASISDFLTAEDKRPPSDYQNQNSPLGNLSEGATKGLIGYFDIESDGTFITPQSAQKERLEELARSLKTEVPPAKEKSPEKSYVELESEKDFRSRSGTSLAQNVYPNPIQEQAARFEERKAKNVMAPMAAKSAPAAGAAMDQVMAEAEAPSQAPPAPAPPMTAIPSGLLNKIATSDPFQARLVEDKYLLFYRKVWKDKTPHVQGFLVEVERFFSWLMEQSFANSELPEFSVARLELADNPLAQYGVVEFPTGRKGPFFDRALGYPLNLFFWRVYATALPHVSTRLFLNALTGILVFLLTVGIYLIYRTAASQVQISQKRQDFVSAVTHELKTPLTSIRMYSEMLEDGWAKDEDKRKEYYGQISKESGRLSRLIENVLQLARLERKTYKLNLKKENPKTDLEEIASELKRIAERPGFSLKVSMAEGLPSVIYDPEAVKQILLSLLDNSMKFGAEVDDKSIELSVLKEKDEVVLSWGDRGPGVPEKDRERVFENFYRVENEMTRKTKGTGIGLAICRMLATAMGARIAARNREGGGFEVLITFAS